MNDADRIAELEALVARWKAAVEGLTPGGSEFYNSPERCADWIRDRYSPSRLVEKQLRIRELERKLHCAMEAIDKLAFEEASE